LNEESRNEKNLFVDRDMGLFGGMQGKRRWL
jgi:hypothetical protein